MTYYNLDLEEYLFDNIKYIGDPTLDGSWRIIISGADLDFDRRESGSWITKGGFVS